MINETIKLKDFYKNINSDSKLVTYCPDNFEEFSTGRKRKAILIIPGGGYEFTSQREAEPIALAFLGHDIAAFVLEYTIGEFEFPKPIDETFAAILYIRQNAEKYHVDTNKISLMGFSAGGHLAASTTMLMEDNYFSKLLDCKQEELKINGLLLGYPVITMDPNFTHAGTARCRTHGNKEMIEKFSIEKHVTNKFPKTFIFLTSEDNAVPPENSLRFASELVKHHIPVELHMYPEGGHGLALGNEITNWHKEDKVYKDVETWIYHALEFVKEKI